MTLCKQCGRLPRQNGSSRCKECSKQKKIQKLNDERLKKRIESAK